jgi:adenylosuccinate synthase
MIRGKFNVVMDSAWGSSGKGKVASWLAKTFDVTDASSSNMPNAGHTVVEKEGGTPYVYKVLPAASHFGATSWMSPGAIIDENRLGHEVAFGRTGPVYVHERAGLLQEHHAEQERLQLSVISSTMQGSGACLSEKIMRRGELWGTKERGGFFGNIFRQLYRKACHAGIALHESSQGWGLSLDHGSHYPHCTSRNCGVARAMDDMAVPPQDVGDVYLVVRSFPIRVGNTSDGHSGGWMSDQEETSWEAIEARTGLVGLAKKELTTVTKRIRRVATFSYQMLRDAATYNGVTKIVLTFPEYLDAGAFNERKWHYLPSVVRDWIDNVEDATNLPVVAVSTGPACDQVAVSPEFASQIYRHRFYGETG